MGVVPAGRCDIGQVRTEIPVTSLAIVLRVRDVQLTGSPGPQVAEIVQRSGEEMVPGRCFTAAGAGTRSLNALFFDDFGLGQVFDARKGGIRDILAGSDFG